jgi:hypothetical protein
MRVTEDSLADQKLVVQHFAGFYPLSNRQGRNRETALLKGGRGGRTYKTRRNLGITQMVSLIRASMVEKSSNLATITHVILCIIQHYMRQPPLGRQR